MADSIALIVDDILNRFGMNILLDGKKFCGILDDMAPKLDTERKVFHNMQRLGVLEKLHHALQEDAVPIRSGKIDMLLQEEGFSPEWRRLVLETFGCPVPDKPVQQVSEDKSLEEGWGDEDWDVDCGEKSLGKESKPTGFLRKLFHRRRETITGVQEIINGVPIDFSDNDNDSF